MSIEAEPKRYLSFVRGEKDDDEIEDIPDENDESGATYKPAVKVSGLDFVVKVKSNVLFQSGRELIPQDEDFDPSL